MSSPGRYERGATEPEGGWWTRFEGDVAHWLHLGGAGKGHGSSKSSRGKWRHSTNGSTAEGHESNASDTSERSKPSRHKRRDSAVEASDDGSQSDGSTASAPSTSKDDKHENASQQQQPSAKPVPYQPKADSTPPTTATTPEPQSASQQSNAQASIETGAAAPSSVGQNAATSPTAHSANGDHSDAASSKSGSSTASKKSAQSAASSATDASSSLTKENLAQHDQTQSATPDKLTINGQEYDKAPTATAGAQSSQDPMSPQAQSGTTAAAQGGDDQAMGAQASASDGHASDAGDQASKGSNADNTDPQSASAAHKPPGSPDGGDQAAEQAADGSQGDNSAQSGGTGADAPQNSTDAAFDPQTQSSTQGASDGPPDRSADINGGGGNLDGSGDGGGAGGPQGNDGFGQDSQSPADPQASMGNSAYDDSPGFDNDQSAGGPPLNGDQNDQSYGDGGSGPYGDGGGDGFGGGGFDGSYAADGGGGYGDDDSGYRNDPYNDDPYNNDRYNNDPYNNGPYNNDPDNNDPYDNAGQRDDQANVTHHARRRGADSREKEEEEKLKEELQSEEEPLFALYQSLKSNTPAWPDELRTSAGKLFLAVAVAMERLGLLEERLSMNDLESFAIELELIMSDAQALAENQKALDKLAAATRELAQQPHQASHWRRHHKANAGRHLALIKAVCNSLPTLFACYETERQSDAGLQAHSDASSWRERYHGHHEILAQVATFLQELQVRHRNEALESVDRAQVQLQHCEEIATKHRKRAIAAHRLLQRRELDDEEDYADGTEHAEKAMQLLGKTIVQHHASVKKLVGALVALPAELYDKQQARRLEELLEALREDEELLERDAAEVHKTWGRLERGDKHVEREAQLDEKHEAAIWTLLHALPEWAKHDDLKNLAQTTLTVVAMTRKTWPSDLRAEAKKLTRGHVEERQAAHPAQLDEARKHMYDLAAIALEQAERSLAQHTGPQHSEHELGALEAAMWLARLLYNVFRGTPEETQRCRSAMEAAGRQQAPHALRRALADQHSRLPYLKSIDAQIQFLQGLRHLENKRTAAIHELRAFRNREPEFESRRHGVSSSIRMWQAASRPEAHKKMVEQLDWFLIFVRKDIDSLDIIAQTYFNLHRSGILSKSEWKQSSAYDVGTLVQLQRMHELQRTTEYLKGHRSAHSAATPALATQATSGATDGTKAREQAARAILQALESLTTHSGESHNGQILQQIEQQSEGWRHARDEEQRAIATGHVDPAHVLRQVAGDVQTLGTLLQKLSSRLRRQSGIKQHMGEQQRYLATLRADIAREHSKRRKAVSERLENLASSSMPPEQLLKELAEIRKELDEVEAAERAISRPGHHFKSKQVAKELQECKLKLEHLQKALEALDALEKKTPDTHVEAELHQLQQRLSAAFAMAYKHHASLAITQAHRAERRSSMKGARTHSHSVHHRQHALVANLRHSGASKEHASEHADLEGDLNEARNKWRKALRDAHAVHGPLSEQVAGLKVVIRETTTAVDELRHALAKEEHLARNEHTARKGPDPAVAMLQRQLGREEMALHELRRELLNKSVEWIAEMLRTASAAPHEAVAASSVHLATSELSSTHPDIVAETEALAKDVLTRDTAVERGRTRERPADAQELQRLEQLKHQVEEWRHAHGGHRGAHATAHGSQHEPTTPRKRSDSAVSMVENDGHSRAPASETQPVAHHPRGVEAEAASEDPSTSQHASQTPRRSRAASRGTARRRARSRSRRRSTVYQAYKPPTPTRAKQVYVPYRPHLRPRSVSVRRRGSSRGRQRPKSRPLPHHQRAFTNSDNSDDSLSDVVSL